MSADVATWIAEGLSARRDTVGDRLMSLFFVGNRCAGRGVAAICSALVNHPRLIQIDLSLYASLAFVLHVEH